MKNITDNPNQKILAEGTYSLSDAENLSIVISGRDPLEKAKTLLLKAEGSYMNLARLSYRDMVKEGLSPTQATRVIACNAYSNRKARQDTPDRIVIRQSSNVADIFRPILSDLQHEEFWALMVNRSNRVLANIKISQGGLNGTVTDVKIILKKAIDHLASGVIVCHNHPSGNLSPSDADLSITRKLKEAAALMDIQVLDHIIIAEKDYYSFADNGNL